MASEISKEFKDVVGIGVRESKIPFEMMSHVLLSGAE